MHNVGTGDVFAVAMNAFNANGHNARHIEVVDATRAVLPAVILRKKITILLPAPSNDPIKVIGVDIFLIFDLVQPLPYFLHRRSKPSPILSAISTIYSTIRQLEKLTLTALMASTFPIDLLWRVEKPPVLRLRAPRFAQDDIDFLYGFSDCVRRSAGYQKRASIDRIAQFPGAVVWKLVSSAAMLNLWFRLVFSPYFTLSGQSFGGR